MVAAEVRLVLAPIKKPDDGVYAHLYAKNLRARGILVNVGLLHVIGQITETAPDFNSRTHHLMLSKEARAQALLNEAAALFEADRIPHYVLMRWGEVVFTVLDIAEQLNCHEILLPAPSYSHQSAFLSNTLTARFLDERRDIPVLMVDRMGVAKVRKPG